ncbi:LamG-like jellyroll fold domain-containing protein [Allokutzneria oryzae]|uniref:LamG-like jellyroll fold domain-containing protein n=1 Tax=Allokutzneria oryzae TaxID=1378989 RepID=A0ABV5ZU40_9PSEU
MARSTTGAGLRRLAVGMAVVLGVTGLAVLPSSSWWSPEAPVERVAEAADTAVALQAARRQGEPVTVTGLTTETRTVVARQDGTLTAELSAAPARLRKDGRWVSIDPTLVSGKENTVVPRAVGTEVVLSNGGKTPLLRIGAPGRSVTLTWPAELPAPVLDGATATYPGVLPDVDLVLTAQAQGVVQHLRVHNAEAARNPALARVRFGVTTDGLNVRAVDSGALEAVDSAGEVVFATPPATMWDASGERRAKVGIEVEATSLTLVPDAGLLTDPAAKFPVTIDPDWYTNDRKDWTKVFSGKPDSKHWYGGNDVDTWAKVGLCTGWAWCNGIGTARSYFQFDTSFLRGKRIISADFNATIVYGPQCVTSDHELWIANATFGPDTTWNNAPGGTYVDTSPAASSYNGCVGNKPIGFTAGQYINPNGWSAYFIKAANENDKSAWRKYDAAGTKIVVNYNTRPGAPTDLTTDPPRTACKWCDGVPYVGDDFIRLKGRLADAENDQLTAIWDVYGGAKTEHIEGPTLGSGNVFSTTLDLRNRHEQRVTWTLWGRDPAVDGGDWRNGPAFVVDRVGIDKTPGVTSFLYQEDNRWHGGVGVPGRFVFDAAGVPDVDHYLYGWNDPPSTKVDADKLGGKAVVDIAPPGDGPRDLYVQSVDRAGHRSPAKKLHIYVRAGNGPLAQWSFDGNARDTAFLGDRHGTLSGNASYTAAGAVGSAIALDGATGYVTAPNTVRTDASMTVSAWAKVDQGTGARAVISQEGDRFAGFTLWYRPDNGGRWVFAMVNPDAADKWADTAWSSTNAQIGVWTHLTAVYDGPANQLRLYVNGVLSATQTRIATPVNSTGPLRVGRTQWDSNPGLDYFAGAIDEVKVYDRILSDAEVRSAVSRDAVQVGHWKLDETEGSTAANAVAGGTMGVLQGKAKFTPDGAVNGAVRFGEPGDHVTTGQPAVRTDQSFTVSAWVRQDEALAPGLPAAAVTQDGAVMSGFYLGYRQRTDGGGNWEFYLPSADAAERPADEGVWSGSLAQLRTWTHLTGVYDAPAKQIRLYVDGELAATAPREKGFNATGPLLLGRGKWQGDVGHEWRGAVDEARVFSRVVSAEEVRGIVGRDNVAAGHWKFDGNTQDSSPRALHGTPVGATAYVGGQSSMPDPADLALRLDGAAAVGTPHVVDTDRSFSVTAWARADENGGTVLSQDGTKVSGFTLTARSDGKWSFGLPTADNATAARTEAVGGSVQKGQWTHLVGVHDAGAKQILLYVNGVQAGTAAHTQVWNAAGGLQIGRSKQGEHFKGSIDDVSAYSRSLFAGEIQAMAGRDLTLAHNYPLDEGSGRNAADAVGSRTAALSGDAAFAPGRVGNAVTFGGAGAAATTGVDVRSDQAFTVSAWVRLGEKTCTAGACRTDAVTIDGTRTSKFRLGHLIDDDNSQLGAWIFEMPESDADNARITKAAVSTLPSETNQWTFLVGVYDPASKKMWLYVNGTRVGDGTLDNAWPASGALAIGRGKVNGAAAEHWKGGVDDVRLYTGQLDKDRITALYRSYPAQQGAATLPVADAGHWRLNGNGDDSSGRDQVMTFQGGVSWGGGQTSAAAEFDGTSGYGQTSGRVVDTGKSFSVSTWAFATDTGSGNRTVVAQDASRQSAFSLGYHGATKKWAVLLPSADQDNATVPVLTSSESAVAAEWTHLTLSYDANLKQVRLYVNGVLSGAQTGLTALPSSGPLSLGRARVNGAAAAFFKGNIDDLRVYSKAVSDGEARRIHDDMPDRDLAFYRFDDGAAKDITWRKAEAALSSGTSFGAGVSGQALQFDGVSGTATTPSRLSMRDSFTVAAWAKLTRDDRVATVASQDGDRMSGFVLQYRPVEKRWVFGAAASDTDGAPLTYAASLVPPKVGEWTHLNGVYDYAGRQLRLYVNGQLVGTRNNVVLWQATGNVVLGREKTNGKPSGFFAGALDEVRYGAGFATDSDIADRGGWAAPKPAQLGRFVNAAGDRFTGRTDTVLEGYHLERALGLPAAEGPHTKMTYACRSGADAFTSSDPACEGGQKIGDVGLVYEVQPKNVPTLPLYRCRAGGDRFDSRDAACGGNTVDGLLGYSVAYADFARHVLDGYEHASLTDGPAPGYRAEGSHGLLALTAQQGTRQLFNCRSGYDHFVSTDSTCGGKTVIGVLGSIWTAAPEGVDNRPLYQCVLPGGDGDHMVSNRADCEGFPPERIGYVLTAVPGVTAVFE